MNRQEMIVLITQYYERIGRVNTPKYHEYSLCELRKCVILFNLFNSN